MPTTQKRDLLSKYSFVSLIAILGIPFIGITLVYAILGVQSEGHTINRVFEAQDFGSINLFQSTNTHLYSYG